MDAADPLFIAFKRHLRAVTVPAEAVYLLSASGLIALSGSSIERVAPLLDGTRTVAQLKQELSAHLTPAELGRLLTRLSEANLIDCLRSQASQRDTATDAYWNFTGIGADAAGLALASATVDIIALGNADAAEAAAACRASGLTVREPGEAQHEVRGDGQSSGLATLSLVLCDDYLEPGLAEINAEHLGSGCPWLLAKLSGPDPWIGPVFQPGTGACWACLTKRLRGNRHGEFLRRRVLGEGMVTGPVAVSLPAGHMAGLHIAVLETVKFLADFGAESQNCVYILDTLTLHGGLHRVARRPQCPACGVPGLVANRVRRPLTTVVRDIASRAGNGQRALSLDQMMEQYGHLVDPVTGIVGELRRNPDSPEFAQSYLSGRNRAMAESSIGAVRAGLRAHSGGKGATDLEAKVGALCEAVERYCGTRDGDEPTVQASFRGLGGRAVHPYACQLFAEHQFAGRARWNQHCAPFHRVPEPFDDDAVIGWTPVWSLLSGEQRLLPTAMLYFDPSAAPEGASVRADSNGNAAGSSLEDAILHGFLELVERDAVALWWYNRTRQPDVCLDSFDDPWISRLPGSYARVNRELWVLDVTSDLGIPVMAAISRRVDKSAEDIMLGFGSHFDPRIAARRALTELGQLLPSAVGARADGTGYGVTEPHLLSWWTRATTAGQPYLLPNPADVSRTADDYGYIPSPDLDLGRICTIARLAGLDILALDQTRPDINMPVVKVIVPGLRHFWPRFAPGRLFDIPVQLGRLAAPTNYEDVNPIPVFM